MFPVLESMVIPRSLDADAAVFSSLALVPLPVSGRSPPMDLGDCCCQSVVFLNMDARMTHPCTIPNDIIKHYTKPNG
jgi:hypothetical protein